jgi:hypothetical protein
MMKREFARAVSIKLGKLMDLKLSPPLGGDEAIETFKKKQKLIFIISDVSNAKKAMESPY